VGKEMLFSLALHAVFILAVVVCCTSSPHAQRSLTLYWPSIRRVVVEEEAQGQSRMQRNHRHRLRPKKIGNRSTGLRPVPGAAASVSDVLAAPPERTPAEAQARMDPTRSGPGEEAPAPSGTGGGLGSGQGVGAGDGKGIGAGSGRRRQRRRRRAGNGKRRRRSSRTAAGAGRISRKHADTLPA